MSFKHLLALGLVIVAASIAPHAAYGHGCQTQGCGWYIPWPTAIFSSYSEVANILSVVGMVLAVGMIIFKFDYLQRRDFYVVRYSPTISRMDRLLFKGRDKYKMMAAVPFLMFGGFLVAMGLHSMLTYGNLQTIDFAVTVTLFALPFYGIGAFLVACSLGEISFFTLKKEHRSRTFNR